MAPAIPPHSFHTTLWSVVRVAGSGRSLDDPETRAAWEHLCATYWYPLYAFTRRRGFDEDAARDLVQGFFERFLAGNYLAELDREQGRFRSYLLGALKHYVANERERAHAKKRGGGVAPLSFDDAENRYAVEPADGESPESLFERRWALALLETVLERLREEQVERGKSNVFERLKPFLTGGAAADRSAAAQALGMSEGALKVAVHRLRKRYRQLLCEEVARTVERPQDVEDEIEGLFRALSPDSL